MPLNQFKLTRLPRGSEDECNEFSIAKHTYQKRKSPRQTKEQHEAECQRMAEASLKKKEQEAMTFSEPVFDLD